MPSTPRIDEEFSDIDRFVLLPTGDGGLQPGVELSSNATLCEILDDNLEIDLLR